MKCPTCKGRGTTCAFVDYADGTSALDPHIPCGHCGGSGVLDDARRRALEDGQRLRRLRQDRGLTLRRAAELCGMSATDFSAMESGRLIVRPEVVGVIEGVNDDMCEGCGESPRACTCREERELESEAR